MTNGQRRTLHHQSDIPQHEARALEQAQTMQSQGMAAHAAEWPPAAPHVFVIWQLLQSLLAEVRTLAAPEEAALVRAWCVQVLEDLALMLQEAAAPTPQDSAYARVLAARPSSSRAGEAETISARTALTARQVEILRRLRDGERPKEIAQALHIAEYTVRSHIRDTIERLGVHGVQAALIEAERLALLDPRR